MAIFCWVRLVGLDDESDCLACWLLVVLRVGALAMDLVPDALPALRNDCLGLEITGVFDARSLAPRAEPAPSTELPWLMFVLVLLIELVPLLVDEEPHVELNVANVETASSSSLGSSVFISASSNEGSAILVAQLLVVDPSPS